MYYHNCNCGHPIQGGLYIKYNTGETFQVCSFAIEHRTGKRVVICQKLKDSTIWTFKEEDFFENRPYLGNSVAKFIPYNDYLSNHSNTSYYNKYVSDPYANSNRTEHCISYLPCDYVMPGKEYLYKKY